MVHPRVLRTALTLALALVAALVAALVPGDAAAQESTTPPEAVEFYRQARELYEGGQYRAAAEELERALVLDPNSPTLVYNLARVYELLGDLDQALEMYERYQRLLPQQQAREQDSAEASIRRLRGAQETGQLQAPEAPRQVEALRQLPGLVLVRQNGVADTAFWVTLLAGAGSVIAGVALGAAALDARSSADAFVFGPDGQSEAERVGRYETAQNLGIATDVALGAGGVLVISAGLLYFFREHTVERAPIQNEDAEEAAVDVNVMLAPGLAVATLEGRF